MKVKIRKENKIKKKQKEPGEKRPPHCHEHDQNM